MSGVEGERTIFLDKLMLLELRKRLQRGDKAEQHNKSTHIMSINYTDKEQGGLKGQLGYQGACIRCQRVLTWHPGEIP